MSTRTPLLMRLRQNHALEHATLHMLSLRHPRVQIVGRSDFGGFTLLGNVDTEEVAAAAREGLSRLQRGESELAVHPRCGTNLSTGALLVASFSFIAMNGKKRSPGAMFSRLVAAALAALLMAQPLGYWMQQYVTTTPDMTNARLGAVTRQSQGRLVSHRVNTL